MDVNYHAESSDDQVHTTAEWGGSETTVGDELTVVVYECAGTMIVDISTYVEGDVPVKVYVNDGPVFLGRQSSEFANEIGGGGE